MKYILTTIFLLTFLIANGQTPVPALGEVFRNDVVPRIDITCVAVLQFYKNIKY